MPQHTIIATVTDRPGMLTRTLQELDGHGFTYATLSVGRSREHGTSRLTIAVDARHASAVVRRLGESANVMAVTDASLALRLSATTRTDAPADFREQADGAPFEV
jgi:acetolactate synthase small subunit